MAAKVRVQKSDPPESKEILAKAIVDIGAAARKLKESGLNQDGIIVLLHDKTKISKRDIKIVLDGLRQLEGWYCK